MSLDEVENKVLLDSETVPEIAPMTEIRIKCRNKIVYVPYYVAVQYDFLKSYLENWKQIEKRNNDNDLLTINLYSPEDLQNEFDSKARLISISDYLGYSGEKEKKEEDENVKQLFLEDVIDLKTGAIITEVIDNVPMKIVAVGNYFDCAISVNNFTKIGELESGKPVGRLTIDGENYFLRPPSPQDWNSALCIKIKENIKLLSLFLPSRNK